MPCWQWRREVSEWGQYHPHFPLLCTTHNKPVLSLNLAASGPLSIWGSQTRGQGVNHYCCWGERRGVASHGINGGQMEFFHNNWWRYISIVQLKSTSSGINFHQLLLSKRITKFLSEFMTNLQWFRLVPNERKDILGNLTSSPLNIPHIQSSGRNSNSTHTHSVMCRC